MDGRKQYENALAQAKADLANHGKRGEELQAVIRNLEALLGGTPVRRKPGPKPGAKRKKPGPKPGRKPKPKAKAMVKETAKKAPKNGRRKQGAGAPQVSPRAYRGLGTTAAYRRFKQQYGDKYTPPQIRNALIAGGLKKPSSALLTAIHGIIRRDRIKAEQDAKKGKK